MLAVDFPTHSVVFLKDYWRAGVDMQKAGAVYNTVSSESHYRMVLNAVRESLTSFASSREFISAIADAMEAHDDAYFAARILHHDVSVANILFTDNKKGTLIDWDCCAPVNSDNVAARRPSRMGTWQFMSAMLLDRPNRPRQIEDDRESAFHVLLWLALRYTESCVYDTPLRGAASTAPDKLPRKDVVRFMRAYDEAYVDERGVVRGGFLKQAFFTSNMLSRLEFSGRPELNALVKDLVASLKVRYEWPPTPHDIKVLKTHEAMIAKFPDMPDREKWLEVCVNTRDDLPAYTYPIRLNRLAARHWVVDTIRKHLDTADWPEDEATPQQVVPKTGSKRKISLSEANLERPAKR